MKRNSLVPLSGLLGLLLIPGAAGPARADSIQESPIQITSSDLTRLSGALYSPARPVAGVVLLPGSGPALRADMAPLARELAGRGVTTLAFDKRGCGESGGSWIEASLDDLAADAVAGLQALADLPALGQLPVGFWGHSQGVWVATVAATRSESAAFLIGVSGGGLSPREIETYQYRQRLDHAGLPIAEKARALEIVEDYFSYLETGEGRAALARALELGGAWAEVLDLERVLVSERNRHHWSWVATFDPREVAPRLRVPVLLVFGAEDGLLPLRSTVTAWADSLTRERITDLRVKIFPSAGHDLRIGGSHHTAGAAWAPGYLELLGDWIHALTGTAD